jgi:hypothetical protein
MLPNTGFEYDPERLLTQTSGITINIYGSSGNPDNDGKPYVAPGPDVFTC